MTYLKSSKSLTVFFIMLLTLLFFIACGSDSSDDKSPTILIGYFLDSAVQGVHYESGAQAGTTDVEGKFTYEANGTVTFTVGGIMLGNGAAKSQMTPIDIVAGATDSSNQTVINIARLLQTLDSDGNPDNGINISSAVAEALENVTLNFQASTENFESEIGTIISDLSENIGITVTLVSEEDARSHLDYTLDEIENKTVYSIVGSWTLPGGFNASNPHNVTFYDNGKYIVYADCSQVENPEVNEELEIGTYSNTNTTLTILSHIQNGCGGFDDEEDASIPPSGPLNISFDSDGSTFTLTDYNLTFTRVQSSSTPIVGSWNLPGGFNSSDPHNITFYSNGEYIVYADCSQMETPEVDEELEIGTYTSTNTTLTILSHIQNGCGGFDDEDDGVSIPPDPINISFSSDGSTVTVTESLTMTKVE